MNPFARLREIAPLTIWDGILARVVEGREITFAIVELDPHAVAATHQHPNEQLGIVLRGSIRFTIGKDARDLHEGDTYVIPSGVAHEAIAGADGAVVIDVFTPIRGDWHRFTPNPPRTPIWP